MLLLLLLLLLLWLRRGLLLLLLLPHPEPLNPPAHMFSERQACAVLCTAGITWEPKSRPRQDAAAATEPPDTAPMGVTPGVITPAFCKAHRTPKYLRGGW